MIAQVQGSDLPHGSRHQNINGNNFYAHVAMTNDNGASKITKETECDGHQPTDTIDYEKSIKDLTYMNLNYRSVPDAVHYSDTQSFDDNLRYFPAQSACSLPDQHSPLRYNDYTPSLIPTHCLPRSYHSRHSSFNSASPAESYTSQQSSDERCVSRVAPPNITAGVFSHAHHNANYRNYYSDPRSNLSHPYDQTSGTSDDACKREITTPSLQWQHEMNNVWNRDNTVHPSPYWPHETPQYRYSYPTNYYSLPGNSTTSSYRTFSSDRYVKQEMFQGYQSSPMQNLTFQESYPMESGLTMDPQIVENITEESAEEMRIFANVFKARRIKLGYTQADVGKDLGKFHSSVFSQTTICRFEAFGLSPKNMTKLRILLTKWLHHVDREQRTVSHDPDRSMSDCATSKKRKKRTCIESRTKRALEEEFKVKQKPATREIADIATTLGLEKEVVRIWFCNRRQKEKKMAAGEIIHPDVA